MIYQLLIIESSNPTINMIRWTLPNHYSLIIAKNQNEIDQAFKQSIPDIIIANIALFNPEVPAYSSFTNHPNSENINLLYLAEKDHLQQYATHLKDPSIDYILKPIMHHEIKLRLNKYFNQSRTIILGVGLTQNDSDELNPQLNESGMTIENIPTETFFSQSIPDEVSCVLFNIDAIEKVYFNQAASISQRLSSKHIPTIGLISSSESSVETNPIFQIMQDFIVAPIDEIDLKTRIDRLLESAIKPNPPSQNNTPTLSHTSGTFLETIQRTMNHEIKNPLTSIVLSSQTLKTKLTGLSENERKLIDEIERAAHRIKLVVDNIKTVHEQSEATVLNPSQKDPLGL